MRRAFHARHSAFFQKFLDLCLALLGTKGSRLKFSVELDRLHWPVVTALGQQLCYATLSGKRLCWNRASARTRAAAFRSRFPFFASTGRQTRRTGIPRWRNRRSSCGRPDGFPDGPGLKPCCVPDIVSGSEASSVCPAQFRSPFRRPCRAAFCRFPLQHSLLSCDPKKGYLEPSCPLQPLFRPGDRGPRIARKLGLNGILEAPKEESSLYSLIKQHKRYVYYS